MAVTVQALQQAGPLVDVLLEETAAVPRDVLAAALAMALGHVCQRAGVSMEQVGIVLIAAFDEDRRIAQAEPPHCVCVPN